MQLVINLQISENSCFIKTFCMQPAKNKMKCCLFQIKHTKKTMKNIIYVAGSMALGTACCGTSLVRFVLQSTVNCRLFALSVQACDATKVICLFNSLDQKNYANCSRPALIIIAEIIS
jgi:hypothetical protein